MSLESLLSELSLEELRRRLVEARAVLAEVERLGRPATHRQGVVDALDNEIAGRDEQLALFVAEVRP